MDFGASSTEGSPLNVSSNSEVETGQSSSHKRTSISSLESDETEALKRLLLEDSGSKTFPTCLQTSHVNFNPQFTTDLTKALEGKFQNPKYTAVSALLLNWVDNDIPGIDEEIAELQELLEYSFGFATERWMIPSGRKPSNALEAKLVDFRNTHDSPSDLIIIYYGGHGAIEKGRSIWAANQSNDSSELEWSRCRNIIESTEADVLFIFDCCYAASAIRSRVRCTREFLAASGKESLATGSGEHAFTRRLIHHLWNLRHGPFSIMELQSELTIDETLHISPVHAILTKPHASIILSPLGRAIPESLRFYDPFPEMPAHSRRALLSVSLDSSAEMILPAWVMWLTTEVPQGIRDVRLEGVFQSNSTLLLISLPLLEWSQLKEDPAYSFIGFVNSENYLDVRFSNKLLALNPGYQKVERAVAYPSPLIDSQIKLRLYDHANRDGSIGANLITTTRFWMYLLQHEFQAPHYIWNSTDLQQIDFSNLDFGLSISKVDSLGNSKEILSIRFLRRLDNVEFVHENTTFYIYKTFIYKEMESFKGELPHPEIKVLENGEKIWHVWDRGRGRLVFQELDALRDGEKIKQLWDNLKQGIKSREIIAWLSPKNR